VAAYARIRPTPGQLPRIARWQALTGDHECHRITGEDCFLIKLHAPTIQALEEIPDRFLVHGKHRDVDRGVEPSAAPSPAGLGSRECRRHAAKMASSCHRCCWRSTATPWCTGRITRRPAPESIPRTDARPGRCGGYCPSSSLPFERVGPTSIVVGFDDPDGRRARDTWPQYKAHRVDKLDTLVDQLSCAADVLRELGIAVVVPPGLRPTTVSPRRPPSPPAAGADCGDHDVRSRRVLTDRRHHDRAAHHRRRRRASPMLTPSRLRP